MACCQLHCHSSFSFFDGLAPVGELVARAAELEQPGLALTDHGNMFGAVQFFKACREHNVHGMIGMEAYEAVPHTWDSEKHGHLFKEKYDRLHPRYHHLTLWVQDEVGWRNLCKLHSQSFTPDYKPRNQPLIDRASIEQHSDGLMVGLGCLASKTNFLLQTNNGDIDLAYEEAKWYAEVFEDRAYVEVMANLPEQQALLRPQRKLAQKLGLQVVATNDVHYVHQPDGQEFGPHHILVQARRWRKKDGEEESGDKSDAGYGQWYGTDEFYLKSEEEMRQTGGLLDEEIDLSASILERATFDFYDLGDPSPPQAPVPAPGQDEAFDRWLSLQGT